MLKHPGLHEQEPSSWPYTMVEDKGADPGTLHGGMVVVLVFVVVVTMVATVATVVLVVVNHLARQGWALHLEHFRALLEHPTNILPERTAHPKSHTSACRASTVARSWF